MSERLDNYLGDNDNNKEKGKKKRTFVIGVLIGIAIALLIVAIILIIVFNSLKKPTPSSSSEPPSSEVVSSIPKDIGKDIYDNFVITLSNVYNDSSLTIDKVISINTYIDEDSGTNFMYASNTFKSSDRYSILTLTLPGSSTSFFDSLKSSYKEEGYFSGYSIDNFKLSTDIDISIKDVFKNKHPNTFFNGANYGALSSLNEYCYYSGITYNSLNNTYTSILNECYLSSESRLLDDNESRDNGVDYISTTISNSDPSSSISLLFNYIYNLK